MAAFPGSPVAAQAVVAEGSLISAVAISGARSCEHVGNLSYTSRLLQGLNSYAASPIPALARTVKLPASNGFVWCEHYGPCKRGLSHPTTRQQHCTQYGPDSTKSWDQHPPW